MEPLDPIDAACRREFAQEVQRAISRLSPQLRSIVVLRCIEDLSESEVAETLQVTPGTVRARLTCALEALDRELTPRLDRWILDRRH